MIVVTGGAGFIGSVIVWALNQAGETDILIVDNLGSSEKWKNLRSLSYADYIHKDQFLESLYGGKLSKKIKAVVHMGACSSTTETDMDYLMENNTQYTQKLATWCLEKGVRFIYASSAATYGDGEHGFSDRTEQVSSLRPINRYGYSKQLFDLWAIRNKVLNQMVGLKFFNVYGPHEYHKGAMRSVICKSLEGIQKTGQLQLFKSYRQDYAHGDQKRDFIYVKDCAKVVMWFLGNPKANGLFNLGTGKAETWNSLGSAMFKALDRKVRIKYIDMPSHLRPQYQYFTEADMTKQKKHGCLTSFYSLEDGVRDYIQSYLLEGAYLS